MKGLIKKYGEGYGITKKQLESFKVYKWLYLICLKDILNIFQYIILINSI